MLWCDNEQLGFAMIEYHREEQRTSRAALSRIAALCAFACLFAAVLTGCAGSANSVASSDASSASASAASSDTTSAARPAALFQSISQEDAKSMMDAGGVTVVDVRTAAEYEIAHIPGAINVDNDTIVDSPPEALDDKDATILVYCRTGVRAKEAAQKLVDMGYTHVYEFGGIATWPYEATGDVSASVSARTSSASSATASTSGDTRQVQDCTSGW